MMKMIISYNIASLTATHKNWTQHPR